MLGTKAIAGILIKAQQTIDDSYQQEFYSGEAEDMARVVALDTFIVLADSSDYSAVQIIEWNSLEAGSEEYKYYAAGVGLILEEKVAGGSSLELVSRANDSMPVIVAELFAKSTTINNPYFPLTPEVSYQYEVETEDGFEKVIVDVLTETRTVMGIETVVVCDRVFLEDVLIEDTRDWFAQDNTGNVWYFGEDVDNYNYDDAGNLLNIDHEGAWEAGINGAQPGIYMKAKPLIGDSYRQEYLQGEAENLAAIVALDVEVTLADGTTYKTLQTRDWNPLETDSEEYKFYAPGIGLVKEQDVEGVDVLELTELVGGPVITGGDEATLAALKSTD